MAAKVHFSKNLSLLQGLHFSSHSDVEPDSDGEIEFTVELSPPIKTSKEEKRPLIGKGAQSSEDDKK